MSFQSKITRKCGINETNAAPRESRDTWNSVYKLPKYKLKYPKGRFSSKKYRAEQRACGGDKNDTGKFC